MKFLNFKWEDSLLSPAQKLQFKEILVKNNTIFARHRFDIGMNSDFKVKLTPQHEEPVSSQRLPTPTNLKDDLLVELALMQEYGIIITTFLHSKHSSQIFAPRKPNGKLRILVDLGRINHLIKNDYGEPDHAVTTTADAAMHLAGKQNFCKSDCFQTCFRLLGQTCLPLHPNGRRSIHPIFVFQFRITHFCIRKVGSGIKPLTPSFH